jgi:hypothetical protein
MPWEPITNAEQLVNRFESSTLDFKTTYDLAKPGIRYDIAKDVAAFANAFGGTLVVGAVEAEGRAVRLPGVANVAALTREVAAAVLQYCVIVPSTPEDHAITITPVDAARILAASGATPPAADVVLVTLNVRPDPRGPIGVRPFDAERVPDGVFACTAEQWREEQERARRGRPMADAYRFPLRIDDQTRFLDPTELPMWMNSHERRVAIQLRAIEVGQPVRAFQRMGMQLQSTATRMLKLLELDEANMIAIFDCTDMTVDGPVHIPLTFIVGVWQDGADSHWHLAVNGALYPRDPRDPARQPSYRFAPYLGGA